MLVHNKLTVSSSTKMSLHDRFTKLAMLKPNTSCIINKNKVLNLTRQKASAKNRRLAIQMANRPSVQAALKLKKRSIKQRINYGKTSDNLPNSMKQDKKKGSKPRIDQFGLIRKEFIKNRDNFRSKNQSIYQSRRLVNQRTQNNYSNNRNSEFKRFKISNNNKQELKRESNFKTRIIRNKFFFKNSKKSNKKMNNIIKLDNELDSYMAKRPNTISF